jgi:ABC-type multidrug transport system ATPase subunit
MSLAMLGDLNLLMASSCSDFASASNSHCNISGFHCYQTSYNNISVSYENYFHKRVSCYNITATELCPYGYYCPNTTELVSCPVGHFCGQGSSRAYPCMFGSVVCPYSLLSQPYGGVLFVILFFILSLGLFLLSKFARWKVRYHSNAVKISKLAKNAKSRNVSALTAQVDQDLVLTSLGGVDIETGKVLSRTATGWDALRSEETNGDGIDTEDDEFGFEMVPDGKDQYITLPSPKKVAGSKRSMYANADTSEHDSVSVDRSISTKGAKSVAFSGTDDKRHRQSSNYSLAGDISVAGSIQSKKSFKSVRSSASFQSTLSRPTSTYGKKPSKLVVALLTKQPTEAEISKMKGAKRLAAIVRSQKFKNYVLALRKHQEQFGDDNQFSFKYDTSFKLRKIENPVHVSFDRLKLVLKSNRKNVLLNDIFGTIRPFHITALMGPSGSGKTTLLNMLRGVAHYATAEGAIYVNRVATTSLAVYRDEMAFVPQDDILYEELTVEENVIFSAILFNRRGFNTRVEVEPMVRHALLATGLAREGDYERGNNSVPQLKNSIVGGADKKGISGGQKKRVSIAMEMMKEAAMFFLDGEYGRGSFVILLITLFLEPTTGLDSATSMAIIGALIRLRRTGVNIVATLHQPRIEIFNQIQSLILLAPGGRLAFFGNPHLFRSHVKSIGYICQPEDNVADFMMDLLAGFVLKDDVSPVSPAEVNDELVQKWSRDQYAPYKSYLENEDALIMQWNSTNEDYESVFITNFRTKSSLEKRRKPSMRGTFYRFFHGAKKTFTVSMLRQEKVSVGFPPLLLAHLRCIRQLNERSVQSLIHLSYLLMFFGALVALLFGPISLSASSSSGVATQIVSSQLTFALLTLTSQIRLFSFDSQIRLREENGGLLLLPYYLGKLLAGYVDAIFTPLSFVFGYYSFVQSRTTMLEYWLLFFLLFLAVSGLANFCACLFTVSNMLHIVFNGYHYKWL